MNYRLRQLAPGIYDFVLGHHGGQRHPQPVLQPHRIDGRTPGGRT
jgi:hypothetical protein